jgi:hypothetical protein
VLETVRVALLVSGILRAGAAMRRRFMSTALILVIGMIVGVGCALLGVAMYLAKTWMNK